MLELPHYISIAPPPAVLEEVFRHIQHYNYPPSYDAAIGRMALSLFVEGVRLAGFTSRECRIILGGYMLGGPFESHT